ncbi:MAG: hypothetical protein ACRDQ2_06905 [Gaiellales bacterium]
MDRDIALTAGTDDGTEQPRPLRVLDVVRVEPVETAHDQLVAPEREVGVREAQSVRAPGIVLRRIRIFFRGLLGGGGRRLRILLRRARFTARRLGIPFPFRWSRLAPGVLGIEESLRLGHAGEPFHVAGRFSGVPEARLQSNAGILIGIGIGLTGLLLRAPRQRDDEQHNRETQ